VRKVRDGMHDEHTKGNRAALVRNTRYRRKASEKQGAVLPTEEEEEEEEEKSGSNSNKSSFVAGNALLLGVAFLWGSYTPMLKVLFEMEGGPTPECVAWIRGSLQAIILCSATVVGSSLSKATLPQGSGETDIALKEKDVNSFGGVPTVWLAAAEIGLYNSLGTLLQTEGISVRFLFFFAWHTYNAHGVDVLHLQRQ